MLSSKTKELDLKTQEIEKLMAKQLKEEDILQFHSKEKNEEIKKTKRII